MKKPLKLFSYHVIYVCTKSKTTMHYPSASQFLLKDQAAAMQTIEFTLKQ